MNSLESNTLVIIPARGGSKGIPDKNIRLLGGKPLIQYSLDVAYSLFEKHQVCVSTDSEKIARIVADSGFSVPFLRPPELATDEASTRSVVLHALDFYQKQLNFTPKQVLLLQPTSPFRKIHQVREAMALFQKEIGVELLVSVKAASANPYFTLFEENPDGFLEKSKKHIATRRQDVPDVWELNGALYIFDAEKIRNRELSDFTKIRKYIMDEESSVDIDTEMDWFLAEHLIHLHKK